MVLTINAKAMHHLEKSNDASPAEHKWDREAVDKYTNYIQPNSPFEGRGIALEFL